MACEARRELDEMVCRCGKRWDAKDPDPPKCQQPPPTHFIVASTPHNPLPRYEARRFYPVPQSRVEFNEVGVSDADYPIPPTRPEVDDGRKFNSAGLVRHVLGVKETATFSMCVEIAREAYAAGKAAK